MAQPNGKPIFEDRLTRLYEGRAEKIVPDLGGFDLCIYDPPRSARYVGQASELALILYPHVNDWIVTFVTKEHQRKWKADKVAFHVPPMWTQRPSEDERIVFLPQRKDIKIRRISPAIQSDFYIAPEWCPAARSPSMFKWLYLLLEPKSVFDPCCGSGNSLIAARELGIPSVGIEVRANRAEHIKHRLVSL